MSNVDEQVHAKFKIFSGPLAADGTIGGLADQVSAWVSEAKVAPKSIGVEYLEAAGELLLSVGYRDNEPAYAVELRSVPVGPLRALGADEHARIEGAMAAASKSAAPVICHEIYVNKQGELFMVFMRHAG